MWLWRFKGVHGGRDRLTALQRSWALLKSTIIMMKMVMTMTMKMLMMMTMMMITTTVMIIITTIIMKGGLGLLPCRDSEHFLKHFFVMIEMALMTTMMVAIMIIRTIKERIKALLYIWATDGENWEHPALSRHNWWFQHHHHHHHHHYHRHPHHPDDNTWWKRGVLTRLASARPHTWGDTQS